MLEINNQYTLLKRKIDAEFIRCFFNGTLEDEIDKIPLKMYPKNAKNIRRCCIYKERAMVRYRLLELLGINIEKYDFEYLPLRAHLDFAMSNELDRMPVVMCITPGCHGCPSEEYKISNACRGCFARPCATNCPKNAIVFIDGKAHILEDKCVKCGKCYGVCPYHAVLHLPVPCEEACPVKAVHKNEDGFCEIDHDKCISCGKCTKSCPFGAIAERSGLFPVLKILKNKEKSIAMIAPSIEGQFPGSLEQIKASLLKLGFSKVVEVAKGAEETSINEGKELLEKKEKGEGYMTTSCCPAYMELVKRHLTFLEDIHSTALSPMGYTAKYCREKFPEYKNVFIGPCLAKRVESFSDPNVDGVITFNELSSLFMALDIDIAHAESEDLGDAKSFEDCRDFCFSGGVAGCVLNRLENRDEIKTMAINGLDKKNVMLMKTWEKRKPDVDLVEVMCCEGGCIQGPGVISKASVAVKLRKKS